MKILSIIKTTNESYGGPPEVLKNQIEVINKYNKFINTLSLFIRKFHYFILLNVFFLKLIDLRFMIF